MPGIILILSIILIILLISREKDVKNDLDPRVTTSDVTLLAWYKFGYEAESNNNTLSIINTKTFDMLTLLMKRAFYTGCNDAKNKKSVNTDVMDATDTSRPENIEILKRIKA